MIRVRFLPILVLASLCLAAPARAQVSYSADALEEIRSLTVRVDVSGGGVEDGRLTGLLTEVIRQELRRADILWEQAVPRAGDCCVLRLDVRMTSGTGRSRFGVAYTLRLELGLVDALGSLPTWTTIWAGRMLGNVVERPDLTESLRFATRELAGDFVDRYRERFPIR